MKAKAEEEANRAARRANELEEEMKTMQSRSNIKPPPKNQIKTDPKKGAKKAVKVKAEKPKTGKIKVEKKPAARKMVVEEPRPRINYTPEQLEERRRMQQMKIMQDLKRYFNPVVSVINTMHMDDIKRHIRSLAEFSTEVTPNDLKQKMSMLLVGQKGIEFNEIIFWTAVDPTALGILDYFDVIEKPMDLGTVQTKVESFQYKNLKEFAADVRLVYDNALLYNPDGTDVNIIAKRSTIAFENDLVLTLQRIKEEDGQKRMRPRSCNLCAGQKFEFEPIVYYCCVCDNKIKRSTSYYCTSENKYVWCQTCHDRPGESVSCGESIFEKSKLERKVNSDTKEESMIQCGKCNCWYHHVCALYNTRAAQYKDLDFYCPFCVLRYMESTNIPKFSQSSKVENLRAKSLPKCKYSDVLEEQLNIRMRKERELQAKELGVLVEDVPIPGKFTVRVVLHKETEMYTRTNLFKVYEEDNYPKSFGHTVKCLLLFQELDGVDTLVFVLYIQSYGSDAPSPNERSLYISYLDSVYYIRPRYLRTPAYQELLIATIDYEKQRGITKVFIWACPPESGTDYVLYCHPKPQKNPKDTILRSWYFRLLEDARQLGVVTSVDNLYDSYIRRVCSAKDIPNFDGDFWPGVAEVIISEKLEKKGIKARDLVVRNNTKRKSISKKKKKVAPVITNAAPSVPLPVWPPPKPAKWTETPQQDNLIAKLGDRIKQKKEDFLVVFLWHICAECSCYIDQPEALYWLPNEYLKGTTPLDHKAKHAPPYALCHSCYLSAYHDEFQNEPKFTEPDHFTPPSEISLKRSAESAELSAVEDATKRTKKESDNQLSGDEESEASEANDDNEATDKLLAPGVQARPGNPWSVRPCELKEMTIQRTKIPPITTDADSRIENQLVETRNSFLTLCQKNSYQFDELRRAKHSTMMFLFHTQNPDVPKSIPQCNLCNKVVAEPTWMKCEECEDFEVCNSCMKVKPHGHPHPLVKAETRLKISREEEIRKRKVLHSQVNLLVHSSGCRNTECKTEMCSKMKTFVEHFRTCKMPKRSECNTCTKFSYLLQIHARQCRVPGDNCPVPSCYRLRQHFMRVNAEQQDRRIRAEESRMNQGG